MGRVPAPRRRTVTSALFAVGVAVLAAIGLNASGPTTSAVDSSNVERVAAETPALTLDAATVEGARLRIAHATSTRVADGLLPGARLAGIVALLFALFAIVTRREHAARLRGLRQISPRAPPVFAFARL
jgi:hypothetical protein